MKIKLIQLITLNFLIAIAVQAQENTKSVSVMFWNVENLFDTVDDPSRLDEEFLPDGPMNWTDERLAEKMKRLASVITNIKNPDGSVCPDILGMSEVENAAVAQLLNRSELQVCKYDKIIADPKDPDPRGIRVVTLTRLPLASKPRSHSPYQGGRFIQEVTVNVGSTPLTFFVNHWKSKRQAKPGQKDDPTEGEEKRKMSAMIVKARVKEILSQSPEADIFAMGDFNDEPENVSLKTTLASTMYIEKFMGEDGQKYLFWNPSAEIAKNPIFFDVDPNSPEAKDAYRKLRATYYVGKYKRYDQLDNFHINRSLLDDQGFTYEKDSYRVIKDSRYRDQYMRPIAYSPYSNWRGVSDHFPIYMRLKIAQQ